MATNGPNNVNSNIQYSLSESNGPAGYTATNGGQYSCVTTDANNQAGNPVLTNTITLNEGESALCEIVNDDDVPQC